MANTCQAHALSQNWNSIHIQWNNGAMDGFVRSPSGAAAMGYWDGSDIPFYYGLANTFPVCDRWFASCLGQTYAEPPLPAVRLGPGQCQHHRGRTTSRSRRTAPSSRSLNRNGIAWRDYYTLLPSSVCSHRCSQANVDKCPKIDQFFVDAAGRHAAAGHPRRVQRRDSERGGPARHLPG